jgi:anthranilate phosphoribosyltransferase
MIREAMEKILDHQDLLSREMEIVVDEMMTGDVSDIEMAGFLTALRMKGETVEEIIGGARALRRRAETVEGIEGTLLMDTCGTGGDGIDTFNISTGVAFILAAAGVYVVKHGNRAVSSQSGSADVLEALGVNLDLTPQQVVTCVNEEQIGFFFAPKFHRAMKAVANTRRTLGIRTVFNILGPLSNPAHATIQMIGVYDAELLQPIAKALCGLGVKNAMVVHGLDGMDEITVTNKTMVCEVKEGEIESYELDPRIFEIPFRSLEEVRGGDAQENAEILNQIFAGEMGAKREILLLNSGAALYVAKKTPSIQAGIELAAHLIDSGEVKRKLKQFGDLTRRLS